MAKTDDIAGLLTGISSQPISPTGGASLYETALRGQQAATGRLRQRLGGMMGLDVRPTEQKVQEALSKLDQSNPADQRKILDIVNRFSPERASLLQGQFTKRNAFADFIEKEYGPQYGNMARQGVLTEENMSNFIPQLGTSGFTKGGSTLGKDSEDNVYQITTSFNKRTGQLQTVYAPYSPGAPTTPVGKVTPIATDTGMSLVEELAAKSAAAGETTEAEGFAELKTAAGDEYSKTRSALSKGRAMLKALQDIQTGGLTEVVLKNITDTLGVTPTSVSSFENLAGQMMLSSLRAFGSNPTEGERAVAASLQASIDKGEGINEQIIERFIREQLRKSERLQFLMLSGTTSIDQYNDFITSQYVAEDEETGDTSIIDFNSLQN